MFPKKSGQTAHAESILCSETTLPLLRMSSDVINSTSIKTEGKKLNGISIPLYTTFTPIFVFPCLVPRPQYFTRPIRFGLRSPSEKVDFPAPLPRMTWSLSCSKVTMAFPATSGSLHESLRPIRAPMATYAQ